MWAFAGFAGWEFGVLAGEPVQRLRGDGDGAAGPRCAHVRKGCGVPCCKRKKRCKKLY